MISLRLTILNHKVVKIKPLYGQTPRVRLQMTRRIRARGEDVRRYILEHLEKHPHDLTKFVADHFGITRQAVSKHLQRLKSEHAVVESGQTRNTTRKLATLAEWDKAYAIAPGLAEDL